MKKAIKLFSTIALMCCFVCSSVSAKVLTTNYVVSSGNYELNITVRPVSCNLSFNVENALSYRSYYKTESGNIFYFKDNEWTLSNNNQKSDLSKLLKKCTAKEFIDTYADFDTEGILHSSYLSSEVFSDNKTYEKSLTVYIPLSSQLKIKDGYDNAKNGTFISAVEVEKNKYIVLSFNPDCEILNNEYDFLDANLNTEENQKNILYRVMTYDEDDPESANDEIAVMAKASCVPQFIAESFWNNESSVTELGYPVYNSFDVCNCGNGYMKFYLDVFLMNNFPILESEVYMMSAFEYDSADYIQFGEDDANEIAENAKLLLGKNISAFDDNGYEVSSGLVFFTDVIASCQNLNRAVTGYDEIPAAALKNYVNENGSFDGVEESGLYVELDQLKEILNRVGDSYRLFKTDFDIYDFEKNSVIVPYYDELFAGDILVNNNDNKNDVAIISYVPTEAQDSKNIKVIHVAADGTVKEDFWSDLENADEYISRRLVTSK